MTYAVEELESPNEGYELTGTGKFKGTSVLVSKQDVARVADTSDEKALKKELDRQFEHAHHRRLKAQRTASEAAKA